MEEIRTDVLVLGGGLAGTMAALSAREEDAEVCIAMKGRAGKSGNSARAGGVFAAVLDGFSPPGDSPEVMIRDNYKSGWFMSNPDLVRVISTESGDSIRKLRSLAVPFLEKEGRMTPTKLPGHTHPRGARVLGGGPHLMAVLGPELLKAGVQVLEETSALELLRDTSSRVVGADFVRGPSGDLVRVYARATVLALGGVGGMYPITTNAPGVAGSGQAMALEAGARLRDMEFVQFTPTALAYPPSLKGRNSGGMSLSFQEARMTNANGERFMARYAPDVMEHAKRDVLSRAMHREIVEGRGNEHGALYLDLTQVPYEDIRDIMGEIIDDFLAAGVDIRKEPIELAPAAHSHMGGVVIDADGRTGVEGLFAAGENGGGLHGANRLASGSLTVCSVLGDRVGRAAANVQGEGGVPAGTAVAVGRSGEPDKQDERLTELENVIRQTMFAAGGIEREADSLRAGIEKMAGLREALDALELPTGFLARGVQLRQMRLTAEAMLRSMAAREESRGAHFRSDFPEPDNENWLVNLLVSLDGDGCPRIEHVRVDESIRKMAEIDSRK